MKVRFPMGIPEMPNRVPPFVDVVLDGKHSVGPELDFDWTLHSDWSIELKRRDERNKLVKAELQNGNTVAFRSSGNSLDPWVLSGDCCTYAPVTDHRDLQQHDVVFCEVQPGDRFFAHIIKQIVVRRGRPIFYISNLRGKINGYCEKKHIYGKLISVHR